MCPGFRYNACKVTSCLRYPRRGSEYCSNHACHIPGCRRRRVPNDNICLTHIEFRIQRIFQVAPAAAQARQAGLARQVFSERRIKGSRIWRKLESPIGQTRQAPSASCSGSCRTTRTCPTRCSSRRTSRCQAKG